MISRVKQFLLRTYLHQSTNWFVWDLDGTLWRDQKAIIKLKSTYFDYLLNNSRQSMTMADFDQLTLVYGSWIKTVAHFTKHSHHKISTSINRHLNLSLLITPNAKVEQLINKLNKHNHFIFSNSPANHVISILHKLGFSKNLTKNNPRPFSEIITREDMNSPKPHSTAFKTIIQHTKSPTHKHLIIGDSSEEDIIPARKLGFKAIHVEKFLELHNIQARHFFGEN